MNLKLLIFQIILYTGINAISDEYFYESYEGHVNVLPKGDSSYEFVKLDVPVHLYSESYDVVYVRNKKMCFKLPKNTKHVKFIQKSYKNLKN